MIIWVKLMSSMSEAEIRKLAIAEVLQVLKRFGEIIKERELTSAESEARNILFSSFLYLLPIGINYSMEDFFRDMHQTRLLRQLMGGFFERYFKEEYRNSLRARFYKPYYIFGVGAEAPERLDKKSIKRIKRKMRKRKVE